MRVKPSTNVGIAVVGGGKSDKSVGGFFGVIPSKFA